MTTTRKTRPAAEPAKAAKAPRQPKATLQPKETRESKAPRPPKAKPVDVAANAPVATPAPQTKAKGPTGKLATLLAALSVAGGATIEELVTATGWQAHSVRGAISGSLKKKHGIDVASVKADGVRRYSAASEA